MGTAAALGWPALMGRRTWIASGAALLAGSAMLALSSPAFATLAVTQVDSADPVPDTFTNGHVDGPVDTAKGAARRDVLGEPASK